MTKTRTICRCALMAAVYVVLTTINPIAFGAVQVRISAALSVLPFVKKEYKPALILGVAIANMFSPFGIVDVICGVVIWTTAYFVIDRMFKSLAAKVNASAVLSSAIVAIELMALANTPFAIAFASVALGQFIALSIGYFAFKRLQ